MTHDPQHTQAPLTRPATRKPSSLRRLWPLIGLALVGFMGVGWLLSSHSRVPVQPKVELSKADPEVAKAIRAAQDSVSGAPTSATKWGNLGMVLYTHNFASQAQVCFDQAQKLDPNDARWPYLEGQCLLLQNPSEALPQLKRAAELAGNAPDAPRLLLSETLINQGHPDDAKPFVDAALKSDPNNPRALLALGRYALAKGQTARARDALVHSYQNAPNVKATQLLLSQVFQQARDPQKAAAFAAQAARLPDTLSWRDPYMDVVSQMQTGQGVQIQRGEIYVINGQFEAARAQMKQTVEQYPKAGRAWMLLGAADVGLGQLKVAEAELRKSVALDPQSAEALNHLGDAIARQNRNKDAIFFFKKALALNPQSAEFHFNLGICLLKTGDVTKAGKEFQTTVKLAPTSVKARAGLAQLLASQGQKAAAIQQLQIALKLSPNDPIILKSLASLQSPAKK